MAKKKNNPVAQIHGEKFAPNPSAKPTGKKHWRWYVPLLVIIFVSAFIFAKNYDKEDRLKDAKFMWASFKTENLKVPPTSEGVDLVKLREAGFTPKNYSSREVYEKSIKYDTAFGLTFVTKEQINKFCSDFNFILAPSDRYKEDIPDAAALDIIKNVDLLMQGFKVSAGMLWNENMTEIVNSNFRKNIVVVAPTSHFNTDGLIKDGFFKNLFSKPPPPDPIALMEVEGGFVQIAIWE